MVPCPSALRGRPAAARLAVFLIPCLALLPALHPSGQPTRAAMLLEKVIESITVDELIELMEGEGYAVETHKLGFLQWKIEGFRCQLFIADDAEALQFHVSFGDGNATLQKVNDWNATKRFSRTYLDDEGDPHLELDLDLAGGVTEARIKDYLRTCRVSFGAWCGEVVE